MPIKVIKQAPQSLTVRWKDTTPGEVYRYDGVLALATNPASMGTYPRAVALEASGGTQVGDIWNPGENSEWTPMLATMTVAVKCEN